MVGKTWQQAIKFYARICGICPVSHVFAAIFALENALAVRPSTVTHLLRRLYVSGQMLQSHLLHLYFMVLPSLAGRSSAIRMSIDYPAEFHTYLNIKRICERISKLIGGSSLHPATVTIGGFSRIPLTDDLFALRDEIYKTLDEGIDLVRLFASFSWPAARSASVHIAVRPRVKDEYPLTGRQIVGDTVAPFAVEKYREFFLCPPRSGILSGS